MTIELGLFATCVFLVAGLVKGVIGMGLPTVAVGLLGLVVAPAQAAALMVVPSLATNLWQALAGRHLGALSRRLGVLLLGICAGTWLGAASLENPRLATMVLGAALAVYAAFGLAGQPLRFGERAERWLCAPAGIVTGAISGATGVFVMPSVPFLQGLSLERDALVQALGLVFTVATLALGAALLRVGQLDATTAAHSALAVIPAVAGMLLGQHLRQRVSLAAFRRCFFGGTLVLGLHLSLRAQLSA